MNTVGLGAKLLGWVGFQESDPCPSSDLNILDINSHVFIYATLMLSAVY